MNWISSASWRRWAAVGGLGLLAILIVFALGATMLDGWFRHRIRQEQRHRTAFVSGPYVRNDYLLPYLASLPRLDALEPDGIRFVAKPALDEQTYAAALRLEKGSEAAHGLLVIFREPYQARSSKHEYACTLPRDSYVSFRQALSARLRDFEGDGSLGTDGTDIVIERVFGGEVTSGGGNFIEPYRGLGEIALARLRDGCAGAPLPEVGEDWYGCGNSDPVRCSIAHRK